MAEAVASMADLTEIQFVQILKYSMAMPTSILVGATFYHLLETVKLKLRYVRGIS